MVSYYNKEITGEIMRLSRKIRRIYSQSEDYFTRQDKLRIILLGNKDINLKDAAQLMDIRPPSLSEWIDKLVEEGEVIKEKDERDKRAISLNLTEEGERLALISKAKREKASLFQGFLNEEEEEIFFQICEKLNEHLDKNHNLEIYDRKYPGHHGEYKRKSYSKESWSKAKRHKEEGQLDD